MVFPEGTYVTGRVGPGKHRLIQLFLKLQGQEGLGFLPFVPVGVAYEPRGWGSWPTSNWGRRSSPPAPARPRP